MSIGDKVGHVLLLICSCQFDQYSSRKNAEGKLLFLYHTNHPHAAGAPSPARGPPGLESGCLPVSRS